MVRLALAYPGTHTKDPNLRVAETAVDALVVSPSSPVHCALDMMPWHFVATLRSVPVY